MNLTGAFDEIDGIKNWKYSSQDPSALLEYGGVQCSCFCVCIALSFRAYGTRGVKRRSEGTCLSLALEKWSLRLGGMSVCVESSWVGRYERVYWKFLSWVKCWEKVKMTTVVWIIIQHSHCFFTCYLGVCSNFSVYFSWRLAQVFLEELNGNRHWLFILVRQKSSADQIITRTQIRSQML